MKEHKRVQKTSQGARVSRRAVLTGAAASVLGWMPAASGQDRGAAVKPGPPASEVGTRSSFEQPKRAPGGFVSRTPLQDLSGTITPADLHFERHHAGVPLIDPARHTLIMHGLVDRPSVFTLADLQRLPSVTRVHFVECSGNGRPVFKDPNDESVTAQR